MLLEKFENTDNTKFLDSSVAFLAWNILMFLSYFGPLYRKSMNVRARILSTENSPVEEKKQMKSRNE